MKIKKRLNKIPEINFNASNWWELINIDQKGVCEPPTTTDYSSEQLKHALKTGEMLQLPVFPSHSQSVERAVKLTSEAAEMVYGQEARHKHIQTKTLRNSTLNFCTVYPSPPLFYNFLHLESYNTS